MRVVTSSFLRTPVDLPDTVFSSNQRERPYPLQAGPSSTRSLRMTLMRMTLLVQGCPGICPALPASAIVGLITDLLPRRVITTKKMNAFLTNKRSRQTILYEGILKGDSDQRCLGQGCGGLARQSIHPSLSHYQFQLYSQAIQVRYHVGTASTVSTASTSKSHKSLYKSLDKP